MTELNDISKELSKKIESIQRDVVTGKVSLLDLELAPFFIDLKNSLNIKNLNIYSKLYKDACELLNEKFQDLQALLASLDDENKIFEYLKSDPDDLEIYQLVRQCSIKEFVIDSLSVEFLKMSKERLSKDKSKPFTFEHLEKKPHKQEFILEMPKQQFNEKITKYFDKIRKKLPCSLDYLFEEEQNQIRIYEHFVYILHLLQMRKIKFQKETNTLYI